MCYTTDMTNDSSPKPWQPQPEEPPEWYNRFHIFLNMGPSRTLAAAYREWANSDGKPSGAASRQSAKWNWKERAMAYDQANREEKAAFEADRAAEARERRIRRNNKILESVAAALDTADLENLSTEEARALLPSLRLLYATTADLQRRELQSTKDDDQLPSSSDWPVIDPTAEKILDDHYDDEE